MVERGFESHLGIVQAVGVELHFGAAGAAAEEIDRAAFADHFDGPLPGFGSAYGLDDDPDFVSKEFDALVRGGMTPIEALKAATVNGAELIGRSKDIGSIEPGKYADIVAVDGDPLTDITVMEKVMFVMKGAEVYKAVAQ